MKTIILMCLSIMLLLCAAGCAGMDSLQPGSGTKFDVPQKSFDDVWKAAITVVTRSLTIVESNKESGVIKAEKGVGLASWGEVVGVFITRSSDGKGFRVEVLSKKRSQLQVTGQDWEQTIVEGMKAELGI